MHAIAYVSTARRNLTQDDLDFIVQDSLYRNSQANITGVLLFCDGSFMQYFEGPEPAVRETYERICRSKRHHDVNQLINIPIQCREYAGWSLGFSRGGEADALGLALAMPAAPGAGGPGAELLRKFWSHCRNPGL